MGKYTAQSQFETDITGYGRKMGRDACNYGDGFLDGVVRLQGVRQMQGTVIYRSVVAENTESAGGTGVGGDYCPTYGRGLPSGDGKTGNPRMPNDIMNTP